MIAFGNNGQGYFDFEVLEEMSNNELWNLWQSIVRKRKELGEDRQGELVLNGITTKYLLINAEFKFYQYLEQSLYELYANRLGDF